MARAPEHVGKAASLRKRKMGTEQHVAGIEQAHRLVVNDSEPVLAKIPAPPARVKQPGPEQRQRQLLIDLSS